MKAINYMLAKIFPGYTTLAEFSETYLRIVWGRPLCEHTKESYRISIAHLLRGLGDMPMRSIKPVHVQQAMTRIIDNGNPCTAKRLLCHARDLFAEAIYAGIITSNPAEHVRRPSYHVARSRLSLEVWRGMLGTAEKSSVRWIAPMLLLALVTAQRRGDLAKMLFSDVWDDHLHISQQKTGERIALPLALQLDAIGLSIGDVIERCRSYARGNKFMLRTASGKNIVNNCLSTRFREVLVISLGGRWNRPGTPPTLHECRSLSERLYREQGIDTQTLLGHKSQAMTDMYNNDRGLNRESWKVLKLNQSAALPEV
jgi:integrase